jgi:DNA topoisomerase I
MTMRTIRNTTSMTNDRVAPHDITPPAKNRLYEISGRPGSKHHKLFAAAGAALTTPSGAKVPPAWSDVWITTDPGNPLQAIGRDSKGRRVYLYSAEHMGKAAATKFARLKAFSKAYRSLIKKVRRDMKNSEDALVLYLIAKTGFRIGGNSETRAAVKAFGASTLNCSHVSIAGDKLFFDFTGKKGIRVRKVLKDNYLAQNINRVCAGDLDHKIFKTTDDKIRAYLNSISGGAEFTVKDFRTYFATLTAFRKIKTMPVPGNNRELKKYRKEVGAAVAEKLGNSTTIALNSYISPEVFCTWESGLVAPITNAGGNRSSMTGEFLECIHYDQEVH